MKKCVLLIVLFSVLMGCSINVEDSTRTISSTELAGSTTGLKIVRDYSVDGDIVITGDSVTDCLTISAEINQIVLRNEAPSEVSILLNDINNGNKKLGFKTTSGDWQGIAVGDISANIPEHINLDISTSSGNIDVSGTTGSIFAEASSGDVNIKSTGVVSVDASSGDVDISTIDGCKVISSSGDVDVVCTKKVTADVSSGDVFVSTVEGCDIEASSGDVGVNISNDSTIFSGITVDASSGDVTVNLPNGFSAWLSLKASSGNVYLKNGNIGDSFTGSINNGVISDGIINIDCSSGDITITGY